MRRSVAWTILAACALVTCICFVSAQEKPLRRAFSPGTVDRYRVEVTLRAEVRGVEAETIGVKTYVKPFTHAAEGMLHWTSVRRTGSVDQAGIAEVEETIDRPTGECPAAVAAEEESAPLREGVQRFCESWNTARVLRYREGNDGFIRDYPKADTPDFEDAGCSMIPLWSRHAWRPSAILPAGALRLGERHERKLHPNAARWNPGESSEMTEWLPASGDAPSVTLHVVQELSNRDYRMTVRSNAGQSNRLEKNSFFAEALSTLSTLDGSLSDATRSAACETTWTLDPVAGLPEPPRFSSKLSVTVMIHHVP
jgi:hypothetical protein